MVSARVISCCCLAVLAATAWGDSAYGGDRIEMIVPLAPQNVQVGGQVTVELRVADLTAPINGVQALLTWNPQSLSFVSATLSSPWNVQFFEPASPIDGNLAYTAGIAPGSTGVDGVVATLTFSAAATGTPVVGFLPDYPTPFPTLRTKLTQAATGEAIIPEKTGTSVGDIYLFPIDECYINGLRYNDGDSNPANGCQKCNAASPLVWSPKADGTACDDALFCNGHETCQGGNCATGTPPCDPVHCDEVNDNCGLIAVTINLDANWCYQNVPGQNTSRLQATAVITDDPNNNSTYTYNWQIILPSDVTIPPVMLAGGGPTETMWRFAAPGCDANGLSDSGEQHRVRLTVTGNQSGNTGTVEVLFSICLLGDVNNDGVVNLADRSIVNSFWRTGSAGSFTQRDCDVNCSGTVDVADRSIVNAIWRGVLCANSVTAPCPRGGGSGRAPEHAEPPAGRPDGGAGPRDVALIGIDAIPVSGESYMKFKSSHQPPQAGDQIWFDVLIREASGQSAEGAQITLGVVPTGHPGSLVLDAAGSVAIASDSNYWIAGNSVGAAALVPGANQYQFGDGPNNPPSATLQNGRALARFAFIWDGVPGAYQVSIDTTTQNTFLLQNFVQVAPSWEASSVTLYITPECVSDAECDDGNPCTSDTCEDYVCARAAVANGTTCDDGLYCNGVETCQNGDCTAGTAPCVDDAHCDEANDQCLSCVSDAECDDGLFCNGEETCVDGSCVPGTPPCVDDAHCDEANGQCLSCVSDAECDDGVFCNGTETCVDGSCTPGTPPCVDNAHCDENANTCLQCISDTECDDGNPCTIDTCQGNACVHTPAPDADNDSVCDAIDQCPSTPAGVAVDANGCSADQLNPAGEPTVDPNAPAADDLSQCCGDGTCGIGTGFTMVFMIVGMVAMRGWRRNRRR